MSRAFNDYASFYDTLYRDKNYSAECDYLEEIFRRHSKSPVKTILDLGCGTGGHAILLAKRGYDVTAIDRSEEMLKIATEKANRERVSISFNHGDIRRFGLNQKFDAAIAIFAVMSYQTTNEDVEATLNSVRKHLNSGGLFIFDVWFGPAVIKQEPSERVRIIEEGREKVVRIAQPKLSIADHTVEVNYTLMRIKGDRILDEIKESHRMRFFFPQELHYVFETNGYQLIAMLPFMEHNRGPELSDWSITVVAGFLGE